MNPTPDRAALTEHNATRPAAPDAPTPDQNATRPTPVPALDPTALGDFVIVRKIGEGGMGAVYLAEDRKLGRKAAVKTMKRELADDPTNRDRFLREARAAAAVESDHIVPVWQIGEAFDGTPFIAMPFLQGEMLDARLKREAACPVALVLKVALEVGHGLVAAHAAGLIHRDIKPGNIWLEGDPTAPEPARQVRRCKVLDFGLARSICSDDANATATGAILGTPAYMAPEQARGERVDARADLFSLGVTLYRMATGRAPFRGPNAMAVLIALATETPEPVARLAPHLPPGLSALVDRLMSKNPADRPASAEEVVTAVKRLARDFQAPKAGAHPVPVPIPVPVPAADPFADLTEPDADRTEPELPAPPKRAVPVALVAAALAVVALAIGGVWFATRGGAKPEPEGAKSAPPDARPKPPDARPKQPDVRPKPPDVNPPLAPKQPVLPAPGDPDSERRAALYALSVGGLVRVDDRPDEIRAPADLPPRPFRLTAVLLNDRQLLDPELRLVSPDTALKVFAGTRHLTALDLYGTGAGTAGLAHFAGNTGLKQLNVFGPTITGAGLLPFAKCADLESLGISGATLTDADLAPFAELDKLQRLYAGTTKLTDAALKPFRADRFTELDLRLAKGIGDATLEHLKGAKRLESLILTSTGITDRGLAHLAHLPALRTLDVRDTAVTAAGVKELADALPKCAIEWDKGTIRP